MALRVTPSGGEVFVVLADFNEEAEREDFGMLGDWQIIGVFTDEAKGREACDDYQNRTGRPVLLQAWMLDTPYSWASRNVIAGVIR